MTVQSGFSNELYRKLKLEHLQFHSSQQQPFDNIFLINWRERVANLCYFLGYGCEVCIDQD